MDHKPAASKDQVPSSSKPPCSYQHTFASPVQETGECGDAATHPMLLLNDAPPESNHTPTVATCTDDFLYDNSDFKLLKRFILEAQDVKDGMEIFDDSKLMM